MQDVDFYIAGTDRMAFRDELVAKGNIPGLPPEWTINHESRCGVTHMIRSPNQAPVIVKIDIIDERVVSRFEFYFLAIHIETTADCAQDRMEAIVGYFSSSGVRAELTVGVAERPHLHEIKERRGATLTWEYKGQARCR